MLRIGIVGGNELSSTANILSSIFNNAGLKSKSFSCSVNNFTEFQNEFADELGIYEKKDGVVIEKIYSNINEFDRTSNTIDNHYNILILNNINQSTNLEINNNTINNKNFILLNKDDAGLFNLIDKFSSMPNVITYGLNNDACVTVSSIADGIIQCCIQKPFLTISGNLLVQQEFSIKPKMQFDDIYSVLGAATAAIISDMDILSLL